jgi:hypothetical protein
MMDGRGARPLQAVCVCRAVPDVNSTVKFTPVPSETHVDALANGNQKEGRANEVARLPV